MANRIFVHASVGLASGLRHMSTSECQVKFKTGQEKGVKFMVFLRRECYIAIWMALFARPEVD